MLLGRRFTQQEIDEYITREAQRRWTERERQQAEAAAPKPKPSPAPVTITAADAAALGIESGDPFLISLERRERAAAGTASETNQTSAPAAATEPKVPSSPAVMRAANFLSEVLSDGQPHPASVLLAEAAKQHISKDALLRARQSTHVRTERIKTGWMWSLPEDE